MSKRKTPEQRLIAANDAVAKALDVFESAAVALETAAQTAADVVDEVEVEVLRLQGVRDTAFRRQAAYTAKADKIREFING